MPILVGIETQGLRKLSADLKAINGRLPRHLAKALRKAGEVVAVDARSRASWSQKIPPSIKVTGGARSVIVRATAPNAYPFEAPDGKPIRHPVFGRRRGKWAVNPMRPFLRPALEAKADEAAAKVEEAIDEVMHEAGFA